MSLRLETIKDCLSKYHPFAVEYRNDISVKSKCFTEYDPGSYVELMSNFRTLSWDGDRQNLYDDIALYLDEFSVTKEMAKNLELLKDKKSFLVVAGHQPAMFGGPFFLILKIISTINLCKKLNSFHQDCNFIPMFWNGSEDHNIKEFGMFKSFDNVNDLKTVNLKKDDSKQMASKIGADSLFAMITELEGILPNTEFKDELLDDLRGCIGNSLSSSFAKLMISWFGDEGLLIVEPDALRKTASPIIYSALVEHLKVSQLMTDGFLSMTTDGFSPPLPSGKKGETLVYYLNNKGVRDRIVAVENEDAFQLKDSKKIFAKDELLDILKNYPEKFSPSAALRPIVQGATMPVALYVAGGGELSYHYQIRGLFKFFDIAIPGIIPRPAATVIKKSMLKKLDKFNIPISDILTNKWDWEKVKLKAFVNGNKRVEMFCEFKDAIDLDFNHLMDKLKTIGISNVNEVENEKVRFLKRVSGLERRFESQDAAVGDGAKSQFFKMRKFLLPAEGYQDISVWTVYFICLYGPHFINWLIDNIEPLKFEHCLIVAE